MLNKQAFKHGEFTENWGLLQILGNVREILLPPLLSSWRVSPRELCGQSRQLHYLGLIIWCRKCARTHPEYSGGPVLGYYKL